MPVRTGFAASNYLAMFGASATNSVSEQSERRAPIFARAAKPPGLPLFAAVAIRACRLSMLGGRPEAVSRSSSLFPARSSLPAIAHSPSARCALRTAGGREPFVVPPHSGAGVPLCVYRLSRSAELSSRCRGGARPPCVPIRMEWAPPARGERSSRSDHVGLRGCRAGHEPICSNKKIKLFQEHN